MSTTNDTTNAYNPNALNTYNAFQPQILSSQMQMAANPLGSTYFQNQLAQQQKNSAQVGQRNMSNLIQNTRAGGGILSNSAGFMGAQVQRGALSNSLMQSNAFNSSMNNALSNRSMALASMQAYQPLQTGQSTTTSGTGTWLPQVAGMAMNMLAPGLGSMMGGGGFSGGYKANPGVSPASSPAPSSGMMSNPFGTGGSIYPQAMPSY